MPSFPSSWVLETGPRRTAPQPPVSMTQPLALFSAPSATAPSTIPGASVPTPALSSSYETTRPAPPMPDPRDMALTDTQFIRAQKNSVQPHLQVDSTRYATIFPTSWLLQPSTMERPIAPSVYRNTAQAGKSQNSYTLQSSPPAGVMTPRTGSSSRVPTRNLHSNTPSYLAPGPSVETHTQKNHTVTAVFGATPGSAGIKEKEEVTSAWIQSLPRTNENQQANDQHETGEESLRHDGTPSEYSGLGDAPHVVPDISDTYSLYATSTFH